MSSRVPLRWRVSAGIATTSVAMACVLLPTAAEARHPARDCTPTWSVVPTPRDDSSSTLIGTFVAALSAEDVRFATSGEHIGATPIHTRTLRWNGRAVNDAPAPSWPASPSDQVPTAMSFDSPDDGWLAGTTWIGGSHSTTPTYEIQPPFMEHWDGSRWTVVPIPPTPSPDQTTSYPRALAAVSPTDAWVVGNYFYGGVKLSGSAGGLIQHWDGSRWSVVPNPSETSVGTILYAITAVAADDVWAVGEEHNADGQAVPLVEHYDGHRWSTVDVPAESTPATLLAVSSTGPDDVWAVGADTTTGTASQAQPMIEHYDGSTWTATDLPDVGNAELNGVYAASPTDVWATEFVPRGQVNQLVHYDGSSWSTVPWPAPAEYNLYPVLGGIAGAGPDDVWAVARVADYANGGTPVQVARLSCEGGRR